MTQEIKYAQITFLSIDKILRQTFNFSFGAASWSFKSAHELQKGKEMFQV